MGRAGGGRSGGGSRGGGGRSFGGSRSSGSRSFGGSSRGRGSSGSFGGSFGGSSHHHHHHSSGYGSGFLHGMMMGSMNNRRRGTVIINNGGSNTGYNNSGNNGSGNNNNSYNNGNSTYTSQYKTNKAAADAYATANTPEKKIERAENNAKRAREEKRSAVKLFFVALVILLLGAFFQMQTKAPEEFQKYNLSGTVHAGYATDEVNGSGSTYNTEKACEEFYETVGIPVYFYTVDYYDGNDYEDRVAEMYDELFRDENHVLLVYFNDADYWAWCTGSAANSVMNNDDINDLLDEIYEYWYDYSLSIDEVIAKGVENYQGKLTERNENSGSAAVLLIIGGIVTGVVAGAKFVSNGKDAKKYEEEAKKLRTDLILSKPLETFGSKEVEDLKNKYDQ